MTELIFNVIWSLVFHVRTGITNGGQTRSLAFQVRTGVVSRGLCNAEATSVSGIDRCHR